jgi:hypothetical protein
VQAKNSHEISVGEISIPRKGVSKLATVFISPGIHSLASRDFARISIFATFLDPVKWAKHASWKMLLFV